MLTLHLSLECQPLSGLNQSHDLVVRTSYDGLGRRVQIVEETNGIAYATNKFMWDGVQLVEQRDLTGANVTKRFFGEGEQVSGTNNYFTRDHLGSVREMTDSTGAIKARYDYDPYGRQILVTGTVTTDFGYAGMYVHQTSGLNLTLYRPYSADLGRWLSRDPIEEFGGLNLYAYVGNNPVNAIDRLGLIDCDFLASLIARTENSTRKAIQSMSDINQMFADANEMNNVAAAINGLEALFGLSELSGEFAENAATHNLDRDVVVSVTGKIATRGHGHSTFYRTMAKIAYDSDTAGIASGFVVAGQHGAMEMVNAMGNEFETPIGAPITPFNLAEGFTEGINNMGENMSESTYLTIFGLQNQLAKMMHRYNANCCTK